MGYVEGLYVLTAINVIIAFGLYWTLQTGQVSVGHGALMGIGAYISGLLTVKLGWPFAPSVALGSIAAGVIGIGVGAVALRFSGLYLAMATLGFGEIVRVFFLNNELFGAAEGMGGMVGTTTTLVTVSVLVLLAMSWFVHGSRLGLALRAIRLDEEAAKLTGLPTTLLKVQAFAFGALIAGFGGALYAHYMFFIDPEQIGFGRSILILMMVVLGGTGSAWGPVVGAAVFTLLPEGLRYIHLENWRMLVFSIVIVVLMLVRPQGILDENSFAWLRRTGRTKRLPRKIALTNAAGH
jgi:branched-chain amino acid transport system permease protein